MSLLALHRLAAARGDGLRPELRDLLLRRAALAADPALVDINPHDTGRPAPCAAPAFLPGNVVPLRPAQAAAVAPAGDPVQAGPAKGQPRCTLP